MANEINTPYYKSIAYKAMEDDIKLNRDVSRGQEALRTETYLAKYEGESTLGYTTRVKTSYLNNKLNEKISTSTGLILNKRIKSKDLPDYIEKDIDGNGSTLDQFTLMTLINGEIDGHSFILVDAPENMPQNLAQQEAMNIHPYWLNIHASDVINWKHANVSGNMVLTQVTIREIVVEDYGRFGEMPVRQLKVYMLGQGETYKDSNDEEQTLEVGKVYYETWRESDDEEYTQHIEPTLTSFTTIPLIPFYANRVSNFTSRPPYMNVTNNTINAFQLSSQKNRALKMVADPDKAIFSNTIQSDLSSQSLQSDAGVKGTSLTFGADIVQVFASEDDYKYIEPTGKGVELLSAEINRIETFVDGVGAELTVRTNMTATEAEVKNTKATAEDLIFSMNLEVALNRAIEITRQVDSSISQDAKIELSRDFAKNQLSDATIAVLNTMVLNGNLSRESLLEAIGNGELPKFITDDMIQDELARIERESLGITEE